MTPEPFETESRDDGCSWGALALLIAGLVAATVVLAVLAA